MAGRAKENIPGGSLKYLFVYSKIRIFKCSYRVYIYIHTFIPMQKRKKLKSYTLYYIIYIYTYLKFIIYIYIYICDCAATNHVLFIKRQVGSTLTQGQAIRDIHVPVAIYMASTMVMLRGLLSSNIVKHDITVQQTRGWMVDLWRVSW